MLTSKTTTFFIENKYGAPSGDAFEAVCLADSTIIHKMIQDKRFAATTISCVLFDREYNDGARTSTNIFLFFTTRDLDGQFFNEKFPSCSAIVLKAKYKSYFGIFAGKAFSAAKVDVNTTTRTHLE